MIFVEYGVCMMVLTTTFWALPIILKGNPTMAVYSTTTLFDSKLMYYYILFLLNALVFYTVLHCLHFSKLFMN